MGTRLSQRRAWRLGRATSSQVAMAQPMAQIQITPLLDVMLVLLVFGAACAVMRPSGGQTGKAEPLLSEVQELPLAMPELPALTAVPAPTPSHDRLLIGLGLHGRLYWREQPVTPDILQQQLAQVLAERPAQTVLLAAEAQLPYAELMHWLGWLQAQGVVRLSLLSRINVRATPPASPKIP